MVQVEAIQQGLGGYVTGVDLSKPLADGELADIKAAISNDRASWFGMRPTTKRADTVRAGGR